MSNKCFFDRELYDQTGHGGHCIDCQRNTDGVNCQHCKETFYRSEYDNECIDCQCHPLGSKSLQCDPSGKCRCKPGVVGPKCDRCDANFFDLTSDGCKPCNCSFIGSFDSPPICDSRDGKCRCKANAEGKKCDRCKPGFFDLDSNNILGCLPCFCNGHTSECQSADNHYRSQIVSNFRNDNDLWSAVDASNENIDLKNDNLTGSIFVSSNIRDVWFSAPSKIQAQ
jgi:laminin gamma 1